jgi:hypothetical protein
MDLANIWALEARRDAPLVVRHHDERIVLPHPREMSPEDILTVIYAETFRELPLTVPIWKQAKVVAFWVKRHDLPDLQSVRRLIYLIDQYRNEIEFDLRKVLDVDLTDLWQRREWRRLLNYIDHLPRDSWFTEAVSNDEEHAAMIAEAMAAQSDEEPDLSPPLRGWSQEASLLADTVDACRHLAYVIRVANGDNSARPPERVPRPTTALERAQRQARHERKKRRHEELVARVLPHKAQKAD